MCELSSSEGAWPNAASWLCSAASGGVMSRTGCRRRGDCCFGYAMCMARKLAAGAQVVKYCARLHHKLGQAERAVALLEAFLCQFPDAADLTHINMLAELYMEAGRCAPACFWHPAPATFLEHRVIKHVYTGQAGHAGRAVRACALLLAPCVCVPLRQIQGLAQTHT